MTKRRIVRGWEAPIPLKPGRYFSVAWMLFGRTENVVIVGSLFSNDEMRWEMRLRVREGEHDEVSATVYPQGIAEDEARARANETIEELRVANDCLFEQVSLGSSSAERCLEILDATGWFRYPAKVIAHPGIH